MKIKNNRIKKFLLNYIKFLFVILLLIIAIAILAIPMFLSNSILFIVLWVIFFGGFFSRLLVQLAED